MFSYLTAKAMGHPPHSPLHQTQTQPPPHIILALLIAIICVILQLPQLSINAVAITVHCIRLRLAVSASGRSSFTWNRADMTYVFLHTVALANLGEARFSNVCSLTSSIVQDTWERLHNYMEHVHLMLSLLYAATMNNSMLCALIAWLHSSSALMDKTFHATTMIPLLCIVDKTMGETFMHNAKSHAGGKSTAADVCAFQTNYNHIKDR